MPPKKSKTQLLLESDPDAVLTKKGRAPSTMSETALEKLKLAREKYQTTCRLKREAKLLPTPEPEPVVPVVPEPVVPVVPEPVVPVPVVPVPAEPDSEEDEPVEPPVVIKKKTKKPKKPVVIIEESASESDDNSNVIFIKKRSNKPKPIPAELPVLQPIEPAVIRREFIQPVYAKNPFYNYNGY